MKKTVLFFAALCLIYSACNQEQLKIEEPRIGQLQVTERVPEIIKVSIGNATYEFSVIRYPDNSVRVEKYQVDFDPNSPKTGIFVNSNYITQLGNKSFRINQLGSFKHFYIPFAGGGPLEILATGPGGSSDYYCECEDPGDEWGGIICELARFNVGPWSRWICEGDCQDCDMRWCPAAMPSLDTSNHKLFGIIIETPNITFSDIEDRNSNNGVFYGGNCRIEISKSPSGAISVYRQSVLENYPLELHNYSDASTVLDKLSYQSGQSYWIIPFNLALGAELINSGNGPHCISDGCTTECEMVTNSKGCLECSCKPGGTGDCDMSTSSKGVIVAGTSISVSNQ